MPAYSYMVKRQMLIGNEVKQPGELISEPAGWPNLDAYLGLGWIEAIPDMDESERKYAVHRAAPRPQTSAPSGPERPPTPIREAARFPAGEGGPEQQSIRCLNCREVSWLSADLADAVVFQCWRCSQNQTIREAYEHAAPVGIEEYTRSLDARRPVLPERRNNR